MRGGYLVGGGGKGKGGCGAKCGKSALHGLWLPVKSAITDP